MAPLRLLSFAALVAASVSCSSTNDAGQASREAGSNDARSAHGDGSIIPPTFTDAASSLTTTLPSWAPFKAIGDKPYLKIPAVGANGFAMTWDSRILVGTTNLAGSAPVKTISTTEGLTLTSGQSTTVGSLTLTMQSTCNAELTLAPSGTVVWSSGSAGKCTNPKLVFQGDGNLVLYGGNAAVVWASNTSTTGQALAFYSVSPYLGITSAGGQNFAWPDSTMQGANGFGVGWKVTVFRPEALAENPLENIGSDGGPSVASSLDSSFSAAHEWALPSNVYASMFPVGTEQLTLSALNSLAITPTQGYPINPYASDDEGNAASGGSYLTYKLTIYTIDYSNNTLVTMPVTAVVTSPKSPKADLVSIHSSAAIQTVLDQNSDPIASIEPTVTFDGSLIVYQRFGNTTHAGTQYYIFNGDPSASPASGWSVPQPITSMSSDPALVAKGYPIARYPMRDAYGVPFGTNLIAGAYAWLSLDGADLFIQAVQTEDGARRGGSSVIGASTRGMLRQIDGGPNTNRTSLKPLERLFVSSVGRTPGMWSPLELTDTRTLPLTDKPFTYPMFGSNDSSYFDVSFEETLIGNYEMYLDMAEVITQSGEYDPHTTQDVAGHFHAGQMNAGAHFAEEAFPTTCTWSTPAQLKACLPNCPSTSCPINDPWSGQANLFSGKAIYFTDGGLVTVPATSATGHTILDGAQDLTVSLAVLPLAEETASTPRTLISRAGAFSLTLDAARTITAVVYAAADGGEAQAIRLTSVGPPIPMNSWGHVAMTYASATGTLSIYRDGQRVATQTSAAAGSALLSTAPNANVLLGPNVAAPGGAAEAGTLEAGASESGASAALVYALDQVGISRIVRASDEIARQAGLVIPRLLPSAIPNTPPAGIKTKDIESPILLGRQLDAKAVKLGQYLFFDPRLSEENSTSCSTCHDNKLAFTSDLPLQIDRLASAGGHPHGQRHVPGLFYEGLQTLFFWDGRAASLSDQANIVIQNPNEMGTNIDLILWKLCQTDDYPALFSDAFPKDSNPISAVNLQAALQEFELSLTVQAGAGNSRFDQSQLGTGALSSDEVAGESLFFGKARCAQCHAGSGFSDGLFHDPSFLSSINEDGVLDQGRAVVTHGVDDLFQFKTPSLRNISLTGPYFHNGSVATLADVVTLYNSVGPVGGSFTKNAGPQDDMLMPIHLTATEQADLVAFIQTLASSLPRLTPPAYTNLLPKPAPAPRAPHACSVLYPDQGLLVGTPLSSCNGHFSLTLEDDGDLVLSEGSKTVWASATTGESSAVAFMRNDGNFVVFDATGKMVWSTGTVGNAGASLSVTDNGELVLENVRGKTLWNSKQ